MVAEYVRRTGIEPMTPVWLMNVLALSRRPSWRFHCLTFAECVSWTSTISREVYVFSRRRTSWLILLSTQTTRIRLKLLCIFDIAPVISLHNNKFTFRFLKFLYYEMVFSKLASALTLHRYSFKRSAESKLISENFPSLYLLLSEVLILEIISPFFSLKLLFFFFHALLQLF